MSIIGGVFCGTLSLFTLGTIGMALYTRIRTVKQCVGPFLGSIFFAALYFMLMSA
jgi:hypothetical protein